MILHNISKHLLVFSLTVVFQAWTTVAECIPEPGISRCISVEMHVEVEYMSRGIKETSEMKRTRARSRGYKSYMDEHESAITEAIRREASMSNYNQQMSDISSASANNEAQSTSASIEVSVGGAGAGASFEHNTQSAEEQSAADRQEAEESASNAMKFATELNKQLRESNSWATDEELEEEYESVSTREYQDGRFQVWRRVETDLNIDGQSISEIKTEYVKDYDTAPTPTDLFNEAKDHLRRFILLDVDAVLDMTSYSKSAMMRVPLQSYTGESSRLSELRQSIIQQNASCLQAIEQRNSRAITRLAPIENEITQQNNRLSTIDSINQQQNGRLTTFDSENLRQDDQITSIQTSQDGSINKKVYFSAALCVNQNNHGTVKFNVVLESMGGGYSSDSGRFTAPANAGGVYEFKCELNNAGEKDYQFRLMTLKRNTYYWLREGISRGEKYKSISASYITHLNPGDEVWVVLSDGKLDSAGGDNRNYFSGKLLYSDVSNRDYIVG